MGPLATLWNVSPASNGLSNLEFFPLRFIGNAFRLLLRPRRSGGGETGFANLERKEASARFIPRRQCPVVGAVAFARLKRSAGRSTKAGILSNAVSSPFRNR